MKKILSLTLIFALTLSFTGCISPQTFLVAADAGLKAYEGGFQDGSDQYNLSEKIDTELTDLNALYGDAKKAIASAKPGIASKIAAVAGALTADSKQLLDLTAIKNPDKSTGLKIAIVSVDAFIAAVQNEYPNPSGDSVQLNSTAAELKAVGLSRK